MIHRHHIQSAEQTTAKSERCLLENPTSTRARREVGITATLFALEPPRMTTPDERQRAILQAGAFLKELAIDPGNPDSLRREANRLLRHFPRRRDLQLLGSVAELPLPTDKQEAEWLRGYPHGAHDPP